MNEGWGPSAGRAPTGGLLTVHAHPDDETLSNGALLATWAGSGRPVTVVTCTRGEQGEVIGSDLAHLEGDGPALAAHRETELAGALRALGPDDHLFLDSVDVAEPTSDSRTTQRFVDSGMAWVTVGQAAARDEIPAGAFVTVPLDDAATRLAAVLRDRRPDVVVCDEPGGGYGHPDHIRAHRVVRRALELAASHEPGLPGEPHTAAAVLWTVLDESVLRSGYRGLQTLVGSESLLAVPDPEGPVPSAAGSQVDVTVSVLPVLRRVLAALRAHRTQVHAVQEITGGPDGPVVAAYALSNGVLAPVLRTETYRFAWGSPTRSVSWPAGVAAVT